MMTSAERPSPKDAVIPAIINAAINGAIAYKEFAGRTHVPLTVDAISSAEPTVGASAAMIALTLSVILTSITIAQRKRTPQGVRAAHSSMLRAAVRIAIANALMLFGGAVVVGVLWQRLFGSVFVSPAVAAGLVAVIAAAATVVVHVRTTSALAAMSSYSHPAKPDSH